MYNDAGNLDLPTEVDHPHGSVDVEVVQHGARLERRVGHAVNSSPGVTVLPTRSNVPLYLPPVTDPRLLVVRHVLHCIVIVISSSSSRSVKSNQNTFIIYVARYIASESQARADTAHADQGPNYKKILRLSYDVIITYDNRKSNLR